MFMVRNRVAGDRRQSFRRFILSFIKGGRIVKRKGQGLYFAQPTRALAP